MRLTYSPNHFAFASLTTLALAAGCGGSQDTGGTSGDDAGKVGSKPTADGGLECSGSQTKACTCTSGMPGRQTCHSNKYSACVCSLPIGDGGSINTQDLCKAGYYQGGFTGTYNPGVFGFGIGPSQFQVTINGAAANGVPALAFTLNENDNGPAGEFHTFTVGNGCMTGSAQAVGTDNPFVARITGSLNCGTGYFEGQLNGHYTLLSIPGADFSFAGPLTAQFMLPQSLIDGEWTVAEPNALLGGAQGGGNGTWNADWSADSAPDDGGTDPCANLPYPDGGPLPPLADGGVAP